MAGKLYVGLDMSYKNSAVSWIYIDEQGDKKFGSKSISIKHSKDKSEFNDLIYDIVNEIRKYIYGLKSELNFDIIRVGVEVAYFRGSRVYQIAMLVGAVYYGVFDMLCDDFYDVDWSLKLVNVQSARAVIGLKKMKSQDMKKAIQDFWKKVFNVEFNDLDQSDAFTIAYYLKFQDNKNIVDGRINNK
jgi:hypothetical protein